MKNATVKVYEFGELSDKAKDHVISEEMEMRYSDELVACMGCIVEEFLNVPASDYRYDYNDCGAYRWAHAYGSYRIDSILSDSELPEQLKGETFEFKGTTYLNEAWEQFENMCCELGISDDDTERLTNDVKAWFDRFEGFLCDCFDAATETFYDPYTYEGNLYYDDGRFCCYDWQDAEFGLTDAA